MHFIEKFILVSTVLIGFISIWFIPKQKYRQGSFIFLFAQLPAWLFGLIVVEAGWLEYPVRLITKGNATSAVFEYLLLPILCIFFNIYFPEGKGYYLKIKYYLIIIAVFTLSEYLLEKYTLVIKYVHWQWYSTFISMAILIYFVRTVYKWFFNLDRPLSL